MGCLGGSTPESLSSVSNPRSSSALSSARVTASASCTVSARSWLTSASNSAVRDSGAAAGADEMLVAADGVRVAVSTSSSAAAPSSSYSSAGSTSARERRDDRLGHGRGIALGCHNWCGRRSTRTLNADTQRRSTRTLNDAQRPPLSALKGGLSALKTPLSALNGG